MVKINKETGKPMLSEQEEAKLTSILHALSPIGVNAEVVALRAPLAEMIHDGVVEARRQGWKMKSPHDVTQERERIKGLANKLAHIYRTGAGHDINYFPSQLDDLVVEGWYARDEWVSLPQPSDDQYVEYHHLRMNNDRDMMREVSRAGVPPMAPEEEAQKNALFYRMMSKPGEDREPTAEESASLEAEAMANRGCNLVGCTYSGSHTHGVDQTPAGPDITTSPMQGDTDHSREDRASREDLANRINAGLAEAGIGEGPIRSAIASVVIRHLLAE
jgi:hypothetical protein